MTTFNLIDNPWIPVRWHPSATGGKPRLVSLHVAFARSREIADLDAAPHERIALTRLLVCIAHAALGAPDDTDGWDDCGHDLENAATDYLKRLDIHPHFNLFGDGPRFLQEAVPEKGETVSASKLFPRLATGNNPTVLDHGGMSARRNFEPAALALALLTFQNFYPLYGAGYKGRGPCADANGIHCVLLGQQLRETIIHNMLDAESLSRTAHESFGRPIWECKTTAELEMSTQTLLGRLVPRHRSLRLASDLTGFFHSNKSLIYPNWEPHREPSVSIVVNRKGDRRIAPARLDRSIWRDLHHLTALRAGDETNPDASLILQSHREALENETVDLWTGALITDLKAKILDTAESTFTVPRGLFGAAGRSLYTAGVEYAELISTKLYGAIRTYGSSLSHEHPPVTEGQQHYWHHLDQKHRELIAQAAKPELGKPAIGSPGADDPWTLIVRTAAIGAYEAVCPRTTPRQIEAFALGYRPLHNALYPKPPKKSAAKQTATA
ncbi:MAG: hypothetical protein RLZZ505_1165 [Verrucomicrobiota bacterium]|jgi:CRISPR system Cascade subunit CasA